jgi:cytochrome c oxidase accessory protein FixG
LRNALSLLLQGVLFLLPWLQWEGRQAVLIDLPGRKLFLWGLVLHPQDTYFLHLLLISAALTLFCVSAVAGRMWCGYACPQTILTQAFIMVERWWEGDRAARIRLDRGGWTPFKVWRKLGKFATWTAMGGFLGLTLAGYFLPIRQLTGDLLQGHVSMTTAATVAFFAALSLFDFGYFREQFCTYVCPYARFQGAMLDSDSLIVAYNPARGEPRGKVKDPERGSCVDCTLCVQVCPMGIDIRNGLQMECIACTACVDACDSIMDKTGQPRGLISYTTLSGTQSNLARPRVILYLVLLLGLGGLMAYLIFNRTPLDLDAVRQVSPGGQLATVTPDGQISNVFKINLINRLAHSTQLNLETQGLAGAQLMGIANPLEVSSGEVSQTQVIVLVPAGTSRGVHKFNFTARPIAPGGADISCQKEATFVVP